MTRTPPLRLTLPVTPRSSREQLRTVLPRNLWKELAPAATGVELAGPLLLGFHGTGFMDACFAWLAGTGGLPPQKAWRRGAGLRGGGGQVRGHVRRRAGAGTHRLG